MPGTSWCQCDKYWLLALPYLARRTFCPILLLSSRFQSFWAEPALCPNLRPSISQTWRGAGSPPHPLKPVPALHTGGALSRESKSGTCQTHFIMTALPFPPMPKSRLHSSPSNTLGFPTSWGICAPPILPDLISNCVPHWRGTCMTQSVKHGLLISPC